MVLHSLLIFVVILLVIYAVWTIRRYPQSKSFNLRSFLAEVSVSGYPLYRGFLQIFSGFFNALTKVPFGKRAVGEFERDSVAVLEKKSRDDLRKQRLRELRGFQDVEIDSNIPSTSSDPLFSPEKLNSLISNTGSFQYSNTNVDEGNLENIDDAEELTLGYYQDSFTEDFSYSHLETLELTLEQPSNTELDAEQDITTDDQLILEPNTYLDFESFVENVNAHADLLYDSDQSESEIFLDVPEDIPEKPTDSAGDEIPNSDDIACGDIESSGEHREGGGGNEANSNLLINANNNQNYQHLIDDYQYPAPSEVSSEEWLKVFNQFENDFNASILPLSDFSDPKDDDYLVRFAKENAEDILVEDVNPDVYKPLSPNFHFETSRVYKPGFNLSSKSTLESLPDDIAITSDIDTLKAALRSQAHLKNSNEHEIELLIRLITARNNASSYQVDIDEITSADVLRLVEDEIQYLQQRHVNSTLFYVELRDYVLLEKKYGLMEAGELVFAVARILQLEMVGMEYTLYRLWPNIWVIILRQQSVEQAATLATAMCASVADASHTFRYINKDIAVNIGLVALGGHKTAKSSMDAVKVAMLEAVLQKASRGCVKVDGQPFKHERILDAVQVEHVLRKLMLNNGIMVVYQPIIPFRSADYHIYEAKVDFAPHIHQHELPSNFLREIFESPLAFKVDRWVIETALKEFSVSDDQLNELSGSSIRLCIRISKACLTDPDFFQWYRQRLYRFAVPASAIVLMLREQDCVDGDGQIEPFIRKVRLFGSSFAISHFGSTENAAVIKNVEAAFVKLDYLLAHRASSDDVAKKEVERLLLLAAENTVATIVPVAHAALIPMLWEHGVAYLQASYICRASVRMDYEFKQMPALLPLENNEIS